MRHVRNFIRSWGPVILIVLFIRAFLFEAFRIPSGSMENTLLDGDMLLVNKFIYGVKVPFQSRDLVRLHQPRRGEIIVFRYPLDPDWPQPESRYIRFFPKAFPLLPLYWDRTSHFFHWYAPRNFIKRCVALAGDTVEIRSKRLYINGALQPDTFVYHSDYWEYPALNWDRARYQRAWENREFFDNPEVGGAVRDNFGPVVVPADCVMGMGDNRDNSSDCRFWGPIPLGYLKGQAAIIYFSFARGGIQWDRIGRLIR